MSVPDLAKRIAGVVFELEIAVGGRGAGGQGGASRHGQNERMIEKIGGDEDASGVLTNTTYTHRTHVLAPHRVRHRGLVPA